GYKTCYGHFNKILVKPGQKVKKGDIIGEVGKTGMATATNLHYEVWYNGKYVNPISYYYDPSILY
ncbi:MAG: M23 family metallopeptidase, partial [Candidatus Helarchaeota archaeon]|nr:M23 family metallopeptidase [Candidatus Helarchaeota archaeon]